MTRYLTIFSKICSLTLGKTNTTIHRHMEGYIHRYSITKAIQVLQDNRLISQEKLLNGFTEIEGQCGFCEKIFKPPVSGPRSNFNTRFIKHLKSCRDAHHDSNGRTESELENASKNDDEIVSSMQLVVQSDEEESPVEDNFDKHQPVLETIVSPSRLPVSVPNVTTEPIVIDEDVPTQADLHPNCVKIDELLQTVEKLEQVAKERDAYKRMAVKFKQEFEDAKKELECYKRCLQLFKD